MTLTLDETQSRIRIHTFAEGLFSRLAHDLELTCQELSGRGNAENATALIEIPIRGIAVAGTLKNGKLDSNGVSASEKSDIAEKMRREVFHGDGTVTVEAALSGSSATIRVLPPHAAAVEKTIPLVPADENGRTRVKGLIDLSLNELGSDPIRGPMNAFRMKDRVVVYFDLVFQPA